MRIITNHAILVRYFPLLLFVGIGSLSGLLHFSGLRGSEAQENLRQSGLIFNHLSHGLALPRSVDNTPFDIGYPLLVALLRFIVGDALLALRLMSWMSFALSAWLTLRILGLLSPGSRADSRLMITGLGLVLAPVFLQSGILLMGDALGLALSLGAFFLGLQVLEQQRASAAVWAAIFMALAVSVQIRLAALLLPLALIIAWSLLQHRNWRWFFWALVAGIACLLPQFWLYNSFVTQALQDSRLNWSAVHFFQRSFQFGNGQIQYLLPNILYLGFPLMHPGFCLMLPGLFLMAKKTDLLLATKKTILICLLAYLLLLGGLPQQSLPLLLPVYVLLLLLLFSAWDRLYCYGFYFFKRLTWWVLGLTLLVQVGFCVYWLWS